MEHILQQVGTKSEDFEPIIIHLTTNRLEIGRCTKPELEKYAQLSRRHAKLLKINSEWHIEDLNSMNGLFINGLRIYDRTKLKLGDLIGFGTSDFTNLGFICVFMIVPKKIEVRVKSEPIEVIDLSDDDSNDLSITKLRQEPNMNVTPDAVNDVSRNQIPDTLFTLNEAHSSVFSHASTSNIKSLYSDNSSNSVKIDKPKLSQSHDKKSINIVKDSSFSARQTKNSHLTTNLGHNSARKSFNKVSSILPPRVSNGNVLLSNNDSLRDKIFSLDLDESNTSSLPSCSLKNVNDSLLNLTKNRCIIPLVRCDSKYFKWPIDVKPVIFNKTSNTKSLKRARSESFEKAPIKKTCNSFNFHSEQNSKSEIHGKNILFQSKAKVDCDTNSIQTSKTAVIKPILETIFKDKNYSDDEDFIGYSQVEEMICVSDDDLYLDFNSSQPIKLEPLEGDDSDNRIFDELPEENDIIPIFDSCSESIENITKFIEIDNSLPKIKKEKLSDSEELNLDVSDEPGNKKMYKSVNSDDSDISEHSDILYPSINSHSKKRKSIPQPKINSANVNSKLSESLKKISTKTSGKTLLTEPKPMERRPRKMRGREEWFEPRHNSESPKKVEPNESIVSKKKTNDRIPENSLSKKSGTFKISPLKNQNLKSKILPQATVKKIKNHDITYLDKKEKLRMIEEKKISQMRESTKPSSKKAAPPVKKRSDNFGSRMQFLTDLPNKEIPKRPKTSPIKPVLNKPSNINLSKPSESNVIISNSLKFSKKVTSLPSIIDSKMERKSESSTSAKILNFGSNSNELKIKDLDKLKNRDLHIPSSINPVRSYSIEMDPRLRKKSGDTTSSYNKATSDHNEKSMHQNQFLCQKSKPIAIVNCINESKPSTSKSDFKSFDKEMLEKILHLNIKWITESEKVNYPPPDVSRGVVDLPLYFDSYESYAAAFTPMLMLEFWEELIKYSLPIFDSQKVLNKFYFSINSFKVKENLIEYQCESVVNKNSASPTEGSLVILGIKAQDKRLNPILGYVDWYQIKGDFRSEENSKSVWQRLQKNWQEGGKLWKFSVLAKRRKLNPAFNDMMKGNVIFSMKNKLRLAEALQKLKSSPLCESILKPSVQTFLVKYKTFTNFREYSPSQQTVIEGIGTEFEKSKNCSKIILLQGPPGTGKTHTIIGLLERLIFNSDLSSKKILVTAPSNAAIDEIGYRLIDFNEKSWKKIKFVRIGLDKSMSELMKPHSLDEKAEQLHRNNIKKSERENKQQLHKKEEKIQSLKQDYEKYPSYTKKSHIDALILECKQIRDRMSSKNINYRALKNLKTEILLDSTVILSTLGSCCQSFLMSAYNSQSLTFSCCIVDEATQCTEPEILQPLMFGIKRLILVGDHKQLPATVNSQHALKRQYDRSLFERFYQYLSTLGKRDLIFMLTEQFRMHSEICRFPSQFFYENKLKTMPDNDIRYASFPLKPYIVYNLLDSQESTASASKTNCNEARAIANICSEILRLQSNPSIGIITPYQAQVKLYRDALHQNSVYRNIEINTVDSFQGREKDIIIVSCVRANSVTGSIGFLTCSKRLNVAITRARQSLIICIHASTLESFQYWRDLLNDARQRNLLISVPTCYDISRIFNNTMRKKR